MNKFLEQLKNENQNQNIPDFNLVSFFFVCFIGFLFLYLFRKFSLFLYNEKKKKIMFLMYWLFFFFFANCFLFYFNLFYVTFFQEKKIQSNHDEISAQRLLIMKSKQKCVCFACFFSWFKEEKNKKFYF
jgi:hypothetical protein